MDAFETFEHAEMTVHLLYEVDIDEHNNPRTHDGNLGVMFCDHPRYDLGDKDAPDPRNQCVTCETCQGRNIVCIDCDDTGERHLDIVTYLKQEHGARVIIPLFLYDHSGISIFAGHGRLDNETDDFHRKGRMPFDTDAWDTSSVGVIFDTEETRKACGLAEDVSDEEIERQLRDEVKYYDAYLRGDVYGYIVEDPEGEHIDSCWGFLELNVMADDAGVRQEARQAAEAGAEAIRRENEERAYWMACDTVTVPVDGSALVG